MKIRGTMNYKNNYHKRILICNSIKGKNKAEIGQIYKINWISKDGQSIHLEETKVKEKFRIAKIVLYQNKSFIKNDYYMVSKTELIDFLNKEFGNNTFKSLDITTKLREYIDYKCRDRYKEFTYKLRNDIL